MKRNKHNGFTLIELLVVISIIALLMGMLLPALSRVKNIATSLLCQSRLKQWGTVFVMYTDNNDCLFPGSKDGTERDIGLSNAFLKKYYVDNKLLLCPAATKLYEEGGRNPFGAMAYYDNLPASYGINSYVNSQKSSSGTEDAAGTRWNTRCVKRQETIPMVFDCVGWENATVHSWDAPPAYDGHRVLDQSDNEMQYICLNRHNRAINIVFMDTSVRKVGLKSLWYLNYHKKWEAEIRAKPLPSTFWPKWMSGFEPPVTNP